MADTARSLNPDCPFSGKPVQPDSLTDYRGHTVGFCNPGCRDKFAVAPGRFPGAVARFDALIAAWVAGA